MRLWLIGTAAVFCCALSGASQAATVSCPGTVSTSDREFSVTLSGGSAGCADSGNGASLNATGTDPVPSGIVPIDSTGNTTAYVGINGELSISGSSFAFAAPSGYYNFYLGFQGDVSSENPDWAVFQLPAGFTTGEWAIIGGDPSLVHAILYGQACPPAGCPNEGPVGETPLPGAIFLMGSALVGGGGLTLLRRRRRAAV